MWEPVSKIETNCHGLEDPRVAVDKGRKLTTRVNLKELWCFVLALFQVDGNDLIICPERMQRAGDNDGNSASY